MNKVFSVLCLLLVVFVCAEVYGKRRKHEQCAIATDNFTADYEQYIKCHFPNYKKDKSYSKRLKKFLECYEAALEQANKTAADGFQVGLTHFCHWTDDEFNNSLNHAIPQRQPLPNQTMSTFNLRDIGAPDSWDWRDRNAVTAVKDQGQCGNCYTFAAVGAVEGQVAIKSGLLANLSTQQYTDCSYDFGAGTSTYKSCTTVRGVQTCKTWSEEFWLSNDGQNNGCNGGAYTACWAYNNLTSSFINNDYCYPATSVKTLQKGTCSYNAACSSNVNIAVTNYVLLPADDENALLKAVYTVGPVACAVYAGKSLQKYTGGIFDGPRYSTNHAILVVGFGTENGINYWIIKNSWKNTWGESGYFRLVRGTNSINIANYCAYPIVSVTSK